MAKFHVHARPIITTVFLFVCHTIEISALLKIVCHLEAKLISYVIMHITEHLMSVCSGVLGVCVSTLSWYGNCLASWQNK